MKTTCFIPFAIIGEEYGDVIIGDIQNTPNLKVGDIIEFEVTDCWVLTLEVTTATKQMQEGQLFLRCVMFAPTSVTRKQFDVIDRQSPSWFLKKPLLERLKERFESKPKELTLA